MKIVSIYPCPCDPAFRHEANVAIYNGYELYAYEEAKLNQTKDYANCLFPERALAFGFKELDLLPREVDYWVFPKPSEYFSREALISFLHMIKAIPDLGSISYSNDLTRKEFVNAWFDKYVKFIPHSHMHASLAIFTSPSQLDYYLVMDGGGDEGDPTNLSFGSVSKNTFHIIENWSNKQNLGKFHTLVTDQLGFSFNSNGKVSGLAGYGNVIPELLAYLESKESWEHDGSLSFDRSIRRRGISNFHKVNNDNFSFIKYVNPPPGPSEVGKEFSKYEIQDVAATVEKYLELSVLKIIDSFIKKYEINQPISLGLAGGIFNNVRLNRALSEHPLIKFVNTSMAPGDSGLALGGLLYKANEEGERLIVQDAYLGPSFSNDDIETVLISHGLCYEKKINIAEDVAKLLSEDFVVGWFQGKAEYGPRSLGSRSILAHPNSLTSKEKVNIYAKRRDWFMPFAPAVLEECISQFSKTPDNVSPYMQIATFVTDFAKDNIRSGVHVDGTARIQLVKHDKNEKNEKFRSLIQNFRKLTGIGAVLNTSFNRHGIATISTPRQAVEHLLEGCVDYLAIGDFLISKFENRQTKFKRLSSIAIENETENLLSMNSKFHDSHKI